MVIITLLITFGALPQVNWHELPKQVGHIHESSTVLWTEFVAIVLALSGVEAIANLTGVMKRPVAATARKAIWVVAIEVAVFNILLAICMVASTKLSNGDAEKYKDDMLAFLSGAYIGPWAELGVRAARRCTSLVRVQHRHHRHDLDPVPDGARRRAAADSAKAESIRRALAASSCGGVGADPGAAGQSRPGASGGALCNRRDRAQLRST